MGQCNTTNRQTGANKTRTIINKKDYCIVLYRRGRRSRWNDGRESNEEQDSRSSTKESGSF